jgi:hypothetical protein
MILFPLVLLAAAAEPSAANSPDRITMPAYCPAKGKDGSIRDFQITYHLTQSGKWWLDVAPGAKSKTPHKAFKIDPAKAEMHEGVKPTNGVGGVKPFAIISGYAKVDDAMYLLNSTLTFDGGTVTKIEATMLAPEGREVLGGVLCGNAPKAAAAPAKADAKANAKAKKK